jgi:hypothetical protein
MGVSIGRNHIMKDLKISLIVCIAVILFTVAGISIWLVREWLPLVGFILLGALVLGVLIAIAYGIEHLHRRFHRYEHIPVSQYGSVIHRRNHVQIIAPHHVSTSYKSLPESRIVESDVSSAASLPFLTFRELLEQGVIQSALKQGKMILGYYTTGELRYGSWLDLYSCGVGGVSGSGKSTSVRFLLFQAILAGARLVMVDPHIDEPEESLAAQFKSFKDVHALPPCGESEKDVARRIAWLMKEYLRRKAKGIKGPPLIFVLDEFNAIIRRLPDELRKQLANLLFTVEQGGRKFGLFVVNERIKREMVRNKWVVR